MQTHLKIRFFVSSVFFPRRQLLPTWHDPTAKKQAHFRIRYVGKYAANWVVSFTKQDDGQKHRGENNPKLCLRDLSYAHLASVKYVRNSAYRHVQLPEVCFSQHVLKSVGKFHILAYHV
jgi:hypothetical protein